MALALRFIGAPILCWIGASFLITCLPAQAQSALTSRSQTESLGFTAANSSGFSFSNNGTFIYTGPLNELRSLPITTSTTLEYDNRTITVGGNDPLIKARMPTAQGPGNTLSSQLSTGSIPATGAPQIVQLGYSLILPAITQVQGRNSTTKLQQVDGQSLSVFPANAPSVFP